MAQTGPERPLLHPLFSDHMIFPREVAAPVWGWAAPGQQVTLTLGDKSARTAAGSNGRWEVTLGPFRPAQEPLTLKVHAGEQEKTVTDILVGDVWVCSGQSNMEWPVSRALDPETEIKSATHPRIRLFTVPKKIAFTPRLVCDASWQLCTPETIPNFSAVGYFFGRELHDATGLPIGLINTSWGGTVAEAWASEAALEPLDDFDTALGQVREVGEKPAESEEQDFWRKVNDWVATNDAPLQNGEKPHAVDFKDDQWSSMTLPAQWELAGLPGFDGMVWFRRRLELPEGWAGKGAKLDLGTVDEFESAWINDKPLEDKPLWRGRRVYEVPSGVLRAGPNVLAVRVVDVQGGGGILPTPGGLQLAPHGDSSGREAVALSGPWHYRAGKALSESSPFPPRLSNNPNLPTVLSNGMIEPLVPFAVKGAIWYQGESNASRAQQYRTLLPAMIGDWRRRFRTGDFPFLIVQLANFLPRDPLPPQRSEWAELREAQAFTAHTLPKCGLALAIDIGEENDIHPKNKQEVGKRLGLEARRIAYGERIESRGPVFESMRIDGEKVRVKFAHAEGGLVLRGGGAEAKGFAVAGKDETYAWARAEIDGAEAIVSSPGVKEPMHVRYAWANNPETNLFNTAGLPAVPFRTDVPR